MLADEEDLPATGGKPARAPRRKKAPVPVTEVADDSADWMPDDNGEAEAEKQRKAEAEKADRLRQGMKAIVNELESEANRRVMRRKPLEDRWLQDLRQYHGKYDETTDSRLKQGDNSKLFINMTEPKTNAATARLTDLLFPTDDRCWGIRPTPVPELTKQADEAAKLEQQHQAEAASAGEAAQANPDSEAAQANVQATVEKLKASAAAAALLSNEIMEGKNRADLMTEEMDDQLKQSNYHAAMRDVIGEGFKLGTGVCKGPVTGDAARQGWKKTKDGGEFALNQSAPENTPAYRHVDLWGFFPDPDVRSIGDSAGVYERHLYNAKQMRRLGKLPGFELEALRSLLRSGPRSQAPTYLADLRNISATQDQVTREFFCVWEYSGPLEPEQMAMLAAAMGDDATLRDLEGVDPLQEVNARVWFCDGEVLKFAIYPLDSGETLYSVYAPFPDEASIFGRGIPTIMRDAQKALNAAWRAMMDNAGLTSGPQIALARSLITPANGEWKIEPRKIWIMNEAVEPGRRAMDVFNIPSMQAENAAIIQLAMDIIDQVTAMPQIAQGDQGADVTKTAQGMALLMNQANTVLRRIVKAFDDDVTVPNIRRLYDWNMQFNPKDQIKGDFDVDARGSSVLLVREMQATNLMAIALQFGTHPVFGPMLKTRDLLKLLFQAHMIPVDEVLLSQIEIDAIVAKAAAAQKEDPKIEVEKMRITFEREKLAADVQIANMDTQVKRDIAKMNRETEMMKLATQANMSLDQIEAKLQGTREERDSKERMFAAEAAMTERTGPTGGGNF